ncbi:MAG: hypothetical protein ACQCN3_03410 [Candidatus Bathyarchaeia archaeon]|jgi:hypothetical protein
MHNLTSTPGLAKVLIILVITILVVANLSLTHLATLKLAEDPF